MGKIGHFGNIEFYVKTQKGKPKAQSFDGMKWDTSINVEEHKRQRKKPLLEVTGKNCDEISMNIYFFAQFGVNPWKRLLQLRRYNLEGKVFPLKIGSRRIGNYKWVIVKVSKSTRIKKEVQKRKKLLRIKRNPRQRQGIKALPGLQKRKIRRAILHMWLKRAILCGHLPRNIIKAVQSIPKFITQTKQSQKGLT